MATQFANTQDLVSIDDIRQNTVILKDKSIRQVLIVGGINFSLKSDAEQTLITQAYQNFLNGLSFSVQIIIHSRKINIEKYLASLEERRSQESSALLQDQIAEYSAFIKGFVAENAIMAKTFFVVVPFSPIALPSKTAILNFIPFLGKKKGDVKKIQEEKLADFEGNTAQLTQRVNQIIQGLASIGLEAILLNDEQLTELFYNFYNPETVEKEEMKLPS
jgi:type IV secretory pathway VirB4 component